MLALQSHALMSWQWTRHSTNGCPSSTPEGGHLDSVLVLCQLPGLSTGCHGTLTVTARFKEDTAWAKSCRAPSNHDMSFIFVQKKKMKLNVLLSQHQKGRYIFFYLELTCSCRQLNKLTACYSCIFSVKTIINMHVFQNFKLFYSGCWKATTQRSGAHMTRKRLHVLKAF